MLPHPLTNFEIQKCYQNEHAFNGVFSRDNLQDKMNELNGLLYMHWLIMLPTVIVLV